MRLYLTFFVLTTLRLSHVLGGELYKAFELIVRHHGRDEASLRQTLHTLSHIVTRLNETPNEDKYRRIRLLNNSFWERVGKVEGGIAFMTALGFELVERKDQGPVLEVRTGAPDGSELKLALELLRGRDALSESDGHGSATGKDNEVDTQCTVDDKIGFDPFTTAFSRKSRTHIQERAERGLTKMTEKQSQLQLQFGTLEDRNVTVLLPPSESPEVSGAPGRTGAPEDSEMDKDREELELVMRIWHERNVKMAEERFETAATRKLRVLRTSRLYPYVVLRLRLPNGLCVQARFNLDETTETLHQVVAEILEKEAIALNSDRRFSESFKLFVAPTRLLGRDRTRLKDANVFPPACVLHLRWDESRPGATDWGRELENKMGQDVDAPHQRVPFSSRYDVPEVSSG